MAGVFLAAVFLAAVFLAAVFLGADADVFFLAGAFFRPEGLTDPAALRAALAVFVAVAFAVLVADLAVLVADLADLAALFRTLWALLVACVVAPAVALRPASADRLRMSATWLARFSTAEESIRLSWADTSWRTSSSTCSLVLRLRSTRLSTHS